MNVSAKFIFLLGCKRATLKLIWILESLNLIHIVKCSTSTRLFYIRSTDAYVELSLGKDSNLLLVRWEKWGQGREGWHGEYRKTFTFLKHQHFFETENHILFVSSGSIMPKANSTESTTTNFQDIVLVNSSNTNLNSRMGDSSENNVKKKVAIDDECDAIGDLIGHYGKWQFMMTILLSLFQVPNTFHIFSPTFQVIWSTFIFDFFCLLP